MKLLRQYQTFRAGTNNTQAQSYRDKIPEFEVFIGNHEQQSYESGGRFGMMFYHEMGHAMELVQRGQAHRLALENFGWPVGQIGHTPTTATIETKVFALSILLEEFLFGSIHCENFLNKLDIVSMHTAHVSVWKPGSDLIRQKWIADKHPKKRIQEAMEENRASIADLLHITAGHIARVVATAELV